MAAGSLAEQVTPAGEEDQKTHPYLCLSFVSFLGVVIVRQVLPPGGDASGGYRSVIQPGTFLPSQVPLEFFHLLSWSVFVFKL